jgi:acetyl-CoA C-acetyltransferase
VRHFCITRQAQDRWAHRSRTRFAQAQAAGWFAAETVAVETVAQDASVILDVDEGSHIDAASSSLEGLQPLFRLDGTITAGNSAPHASGAAALLVALEPWAEKRRIQPMARLAGWGVGAVEPRLAGLGALPAVRQALDRAGWTRNDLQRVEINEPYAVTALALNSALGLPEDIVNVDGGAIAHGHPIGATGAILTTRLLHGMKRTGVRCGLVAMSIGGGQGVALALETL